MYNIVSPNESIIKQIYYFAKHGINNVEQNNIEMLFREIEKNDIKRYVKVKKNLFNQTGFTNTILLSLLTGFAGGVITTIMYMVIK